MEATTSTVDPSKLVPGPVCSVCPLYSGCTSICEPVESLLPSMERGRIDPEDIPRIYLGIRLTQAILDHPQLLTPHQQEIVRLYYRESLRQQEIANLLEVSQQAVHDALQRARTAVGTALMAQSRRHPENGLETGQERVSE